MKSNSIIRFAGVLACAGVLHVSATSAATVTTLYSFKGGSDGANPQARLIVVNGTLYGTTYGGGSTNCNSAGCGAVFSISPSGTEKVLHAFTGGSDGANPEASLIDVNGTLYGTTYGGGVYGNGTVFSITRRGTEKVRHSFGSAGDAITPDAGLIDVGGTLYGTSAQGGTNSCTFVNGCGTVFSITPAGTEKVVYSFKGGSDGYAPEAGLIHVNGTLYGSTLLGGGTGCSLSVGCGTVFSVTPDGTEKTLFAFQAESVSFPLAPLINIKGVLYGTAAGGPSELPCSGAGCGSVFSVTLSGTEKELHSFGSGSDGSFPWSSLIDVSGTLYGTTEFGGRYNAGTVFSITRRGTETVLYSFKGGSDGANPRSGLINVNGTLYGTTYYRGASSGVGCGTVFSIRP